jgi:hypothetical protein
MLQSHDIPYNCEFGSGIGTRSSGNRGNRADTAVEKSAAQRRLVEIFSDENEFVDTGLVDLPWLAGPAIESHVDPVKNEPPGFVRKIDDSFDPEQVLAPRLGEGVDPAAEPCDIDCPAFAKRYAGDVEVVLMRAVKEQFRVKFQCVPKIERPHVEHRGKVDAAVHRGMYTSECIERSQQPTTLRNIRFGDEISLVEEDHIGECELLARLFIVQLIDNMTGVGDRDDRIKLRMRSQRLVQNE